MASASAKNARGLLQLLCGYWPFLPEKGPLAEESTPQQYVKVIASGDLDESLLAAIENYVERQKLRLGLGPKPSHLQGRENRGVHERLAAGLGEERGEVSANETQKSKIKVI